MNSRNNKRVNIILSSLFLLAISPIFYYVWDVIIKDFNIEVSEVKTGICMATGTSSIYSIKTPILRNGVEYGHMIKKYKKTYFITSSRLKDYTIGQMFCFNYERVKFRHALRVKKFIQ